MEGLGEAGICLVQVFQDATVAAKEIANASNRPPQDHKRQR
jgi:hypothetical protein